MKKRFFIVYVAVLSIFSFPIVLNLIVLKNAGELSSVESIVYEQMLQDIIYGSATNQNTYFYKLALLKSIKPEIVALGSSRVMQLRKEMFNVGFINAGGAINSVDEAEKFVNDMMKLHKPKIVILGLDDWWFNPHSPAANWKNPEVDTSTEITLEKILAPIQWIYNGKIKFDDYTNLFFSNETMYASKLFHSNLLGISAIKKESGFRADGSHCYGRMLTAVNQNDFQFKDTIRRIDNGVDRFEYAENISNIKWRKMISLIRKLEASGIIVITFIPPFSKTAYQKIEASNKYAYMKVISDLAQKENIYNFRNPKTLDLTDCYFTDGFHGGEIAYLKLLFNMAEVQKYVDGKFINKQYLEENMSYLNMQIGVKDIYKETDILGIGCKRRN